MSPRDLTERLAKADDGSRDLSNEIALAAGWQRRDTNFPWLSPDGQSFYVPPDFSRSLDDAMSLVPGGKPWYVNTGYVASASARVGVEHEPVEAATPALSLCIAALKARAA